MPAASTCLHLKIAGDQWLIKLTALFMVSILKACQDMHGAGYALFPGSHKTDKRKKMADLKKVYAFGILGKAA